MMMMMMIIIMIMMMMMIIIIIIIISVHSSEASVFIKGEKFRVSLSYWQLLKKKSSPRCLTVTYIR
jgi:hypothetical protein